MKVVNADIGIYRSAELGTVLNLNEGQPLYITIANLVCTSSPLLVVCKGAVFVMPWYEVKAEFERIENWYKLEAPLVKKPYFHLKTLTKPIGNEEILTALYAGI